MATGISANRLELLQIADAVAREKSIEKEIVIEAIEEAIQKGARARYGAEHDIRAKIDPKTGELALTRHMLVVDAITEPEFEGMQLTLAEASGGSEAFVGKEYVETLPVRVRPGADADGAQVVTARSARRSANVSTKSSRTASPRSSTAWSSASSTATPSSTSAAARA